jgi:hypothetical protein
MGIPSLWATNTVINSIRGEKRHKSRKASKRLKYKYIELLLLASDGLRISESTSVEDAVVASMEASLGLEIDGRAAVSQALLQCIMQSLARFLV